MITKFNHFPLVQQIETGGIS